MKAPQRFKVQPQQRNAINLARSWTTAEIVPSTKHIEDLMQTNTEELIAMHEQILARRVDY
jgi:hypothetical protein